MIGAIMAAGGAVVRRKALAERQGDDYAQPFRMINMMAHYLRRALGELGVEPPFERVPCTGLRWTGPEVERIAA
ncbi:MAG: hypothetical protein EOO77_35460 [Oxalobacteraceae bacterium]|nr:MAG: hypothetical protein EOO77_35460 [Oxalobacteraceae bacterium]